MDWIEVSLGIVDGEAAEAIAEVLQRYGHQGVSVQREGLMPNMYDETDPPPVGGYTVRAYFLNDDHAEQTKTQLEHALRLMNLMYPMPAPAYSIVRDEDWAEAWKVHYHPVRIGKRLLIRPAWVELQPEDGVMVVTLDPGMAFGTGTHPTTQLCLEALEELVKPGIRALDLGAGSGILAIAAVKLGAVHVHALDTDSLAVQVTSENAEKNGVADSITSQQGSLESLLTSARRFDLIVVNILAKIIIEMCAQGLGQIVRPGGLAVFSGIIDTQADEVEAALRSTGLLPYKRRQQGDWIVIEARRPYEDD